MTLKINVLPISKHINRNFREYAIYTLENRAIPNWYDSLTNVQRIILLNSPSRFNKTISVMGECIKGGYHHGDASLGSAINKLARPYGVSARILEGDGFFGSQVSPEPAAPRYTSIRLSSRIREVIDLYAFLNTKDDEGSPLPLHLPAPLGLLTNMIGIAIGYKTTILPRKLETIQKYMEGKVKNVPPSFEGFTGTVKKYNNLPNSWLIEGSVEINEKEKTIRITCLPPLMKYESLTKKIDALLSEVYFDIRNNSGTDVDIQVVFNRFIEKPLWEEMKIRFQKMVKMIVTESIIFVKDGSVLTYSKVEDYLDDFKDQVERTKLVSLEFHANTYLQELEFLEWKLKYLTFMLEKKRTESEIDTFLSQAPNAISNRLDRIRLRTLSKQEVDRTIKEIEECKGKITETLKAVIEQKKVVDALPPSLRTLTNTSTGRALVDSDDDMDEIDGIEVFGVTDDILEEEEITE